MDDDDARRVATWHYPGEYAFYDWDRDPDDLAVLLDPEKRKASYFSVDNEDGDLIGFLHVTQNRDVATIGLGLRPDRTGHGLGLSFVLACLGFARDRFSIEQFRLDVAVFNQRAIRVYRQAGFRVVRRYSHRTNGGWYDFLEMAYDVRPPAD